MQTENKARSRGSFERTTPKPPLTQLRSWRASLVNVYLKTQPNLLRLHSIPLADYGSLTTSKHSNMV
jgi:hypothetical protein